MRRSTAATRNDWQPPRPIPEGSGVTNSDGSLASVSAASNSSGNLLPAAGTASSNSDSSRPLQASINAATNGSSSNEPTGTESLSNSHSNSLPSSVALIDNNSRSLHDRASANPMSASEPMIHQGDRLLTASEVKERYYTDDSHRHTYVVVDCIRLGCMSEISSRPLHSPDWDSSAKNFKHTTGVHSRVEVESCIKVVHMGDLDKDASIFSPQNNPYETHAIDFMIPSGGVGSTKMPVSMAQGQHRLVGYVKNLSPEVARGATDLENAPRIRLTTGTVPCAIGFRNKLFVLAEVSYTTRENLVNEIIKNADLNNRGDMRVKELTFDRASTVRKVMNLLLWDEGGLMQGVFGVRGLLHKARKKMSKKFQEDPDKAAFQSVAHEMAERLAQLAEEDGNSQISLNAGGTTVSTADGSGTASRYNRAAYIKVLKRFMELALVAPRWWLGFVAAASGAEDLEAWQSFEEVAPGADLAGALRKRKFHFQALTLESVSNTQQTSFHPGGQTFAGQGAYIMTILECGVLRGKRGASVEIQADEEDADDEEGGGDHAPGSSVGQAAELMTPALVRKLAIARSYNANGLDRAMCMWLGVIEEPHGVEVEGPRAAYEILLMKHVLNGDGAAVLDTLDYVKTDKVVDGDVVGFKGGEAHAALLEAIEIGDDMEKPRGRRVYVHPSTPLDFVNLLKEDSTFIEKVGSWPAYCDVWAEAFAAFEEASASGVAASSGSTAGDGEDESVGRRASERIRALNAASQAESNDVGTGWAGSIGSGRSSQKKYSKDVPVEQNMDQESTSTVGGANDAAIGDVASQRKERECPWSTNDEFCTRAETLVREAAADDTMSDGDEGEELSFGDWCRRWPYAVQQKEMLRGNEREVAKGTYKCLWNLTDAQFYFEGCVVGLLPCNWINCSPKGIVTAAKTCLMYLKHETFDGKDQYEACLKDLAEADIILGVVHVNELTKAVVVVDSRSNVCHIICCDPRADWLGSDMPALENYFGICHETRMSVYIKRAIWAQISAVLLAVNEYKTAMLSPQCCETESERTECEHLSLVAWSAEKGGAWKQSHERLWYAKAIACALAENADDRINDVNDLDRALERLKELAVLEEIVGRENVQAMPSQMQVGDAVEVHGLERDIEGLQSRTLNQENRPSVNKRQLERNGRINPTDEESENGSSFHVSPLKKAPRPNADEM